MSSSDDEDVLSIINVLNLNCRRKYWIHPYLRRNSKYRIFKVARDLEMYPERFQSFYRMSKETFILLLDNTRDNLKKQDTNWRKPISPEERLLITLRYFAAGSSFKSLSYYFLRGESTIRKIIFQTSKIIWKNLQPQFMPKPDIEKWYDVVQRFYTLWNLPNCLGSIDGKHIRIKAPPKSGSAYFNYKGYFSLVLLTVVDADGLFITVDVGEYGRNSDGRALKESNFLKCISNGSLQLPQDKPLPGEKQNFPYYFIGDEAFPLKKHLMIPFPRAELNNNRRKYNYRICRPRKIVECGFGMLSSKFRLLHSPILCHPKNVDRIILAMCVLHNFIRICDGTISTPTTKNVLLTVSEPPILRRIPKNFREHLCQYFCERSPITAQNAYCVNE